MTSTPCRCCGSHTRHGFVDETARGNSYGIAAVIVCPCRTAALRRTARGHLRRGQRRVHASKQNDADRKLFLDAVIARDVAAIFVVTQGRKLTARSPCWALLMPRLVSAGVTSLVIEGIEGREDHDRRDIRDALLRLGNVGLLAYRHADPATEPLLWVADAIAWAAGAGGHWRARVAPVLI